MSDAKKAENPPDANAVIEDLLRTVEGSPSPAPAAPADAPPAAPPVEAQPAPPADPAPEPSPEPAPTAAPAPTLPKKTHAPVALAPVSDADAQQEIKKLRNDVLEARQALRQREAELEVSQQMGRDTLGKLKDQHERTLRAIADLDNYKKRAVKERDEATKFGQEKLLRDFLPVVDNLERALEHAKSPSDFEGLKQGVAMTRKLFEDTLGRHAVKAFSALDQMFDPHRHEAIQTIESDAPPGTVVLEVVRGFTLHDRLMRPAMVGVAKARAGSEPSPAEPKDDAATPAAPAPEPGAEPASPTESLPAEAPADEKPQS